jgi:DNA-binding LacI/PurR family transcriptional regulator
MQDIADAAGVSRPTVSYVLNGRREGVFVGEETRERVLEAARALGYRRNELARAIVTGRNTMLGFLAALPEAEATARMMSGALDEADAHGYTLKVLRLSGRTLDPSTIERCVELRLAGVLAIYLDGESLGRLHDELARHQIPLAVLEREGAPAWGVGVVTDDAQAMRLAIEHLKQLGHRRVALLSQSGSAVFESREEAFRTVMRECGMQVLAGSVARVALEPGSHGHDEIEERARRFLQRPPASRPTAIIGVTDHIAMLAMRAAHRAGRRVPGDISFVGFGNLEMAPFAFPALTSVALPFGDIGRAAVRLVLGRAVPDRWSDDPLDEILPAHLAVRDSTAPVTASVT